MKKITFEEVRKVFRKYNKDNGVIHGMPSNVPTISAVIVYKQSNFTKPYTETERSYRITNTCGKAFFNMPSGSQSMRGDCIDGHDLGVRLDAYGWDIEYCYMEE